MATVIWSFIVFGGGVNSELRNTLAIFFTEGLQAILGGSEDARAVAVIEADGCRDLSPGVLPLHSHPEDREVLETALLVGG